MRNVFIAGFLLFGVLFINRTIYSQHKNPFNYAIAIYGRIGYQAVDNMSNTRTIPIWNGDDLPAAFNFDAGMDLPMGKDYFVGVSYNGWTSKDDVRDDKDTITFSRKIYGSNVDVMVKYRFYFGKFIFSPNVGIGSTVIKTKYLGYQFAEDKPRSDIMANITLQLDFDYILTNRLLFSTNISYYGAKQLTSGTSRINNLFQFKTGLIYSIQF
jgi:hypothetical protein